MTQQARNDDASNEEEDGHALEGQSGSARVFESSTQPGVGGGAGSASGECVWCQLAEACSEAPC